MFDSHDVPPVDSSESLARYILFSSHVRSNRTIKPDALIPHPHLELSVTRHRNATEEELWSEGKRVSGLRRATLHGRADLAATVFEAEGLTVEASPLPENPNHADVRNWPLDKPAQKMKAMVIATSARFLPGPTGQ